VTKSVFSGSFTQQAKLPESAIAAAVDVLSHGRLHRYNTLGAEQSETELLEHEFAQWQGAKYCLACASGGQAMQISLRAAGVVQGDKVLTNGFTLAPVPGAIAAVGGVPVLVEVTHDLVIDLDDLERKISSTSARYLLLSHMRGHLVDMTRLTEIASRLELTVIEDCAHTMGASWAGKKSGNFGVSGCFSTQTYKHMNSGEGGLLTTDDPDLMARAIILSGSYMLYERHGAKPSAEHFDVPRLNMPNMSARMDNLRAAILRPQLRELDTAIAGWNQRYDIIADHLRSSNAVALPNRPDEGKFVGSSIQFRIPGVQPETAQKLLAAFGQRGVEVKWFGGAAPVGFTSSHRSWHYIERQSLPATDDVLAGLFDMRLPLAFSLEDCALIGEILVDEIRTNTQFAA